ncbi:MAG: glycosyltransferase family 2 protein [Elusimicrobia bacterium]|nr:glycosyltransferase family 2 protein [Elusimicrobiota bacterium]
MIGALARMQTVLEWILVYYFFILNSVYIVISLVAYFEVYRHLRRGVHRGYEHIARSPLTPPLSVIVPAHNEAVGIALTVGNLLHLDYLRYEVIVVNDGSTDSTLDELKKAFELKLSADEFPEVLQTARVRGIYRSRRHHNLVVIDKENGGKSDALNAGLNQASYPYFCSCDADVIMESDALQRVILPIMESEKRVIAVGGIVRVANGCKILRGRITEPALNANPLTMFQVVEYFRAFLCGRTGYSRLNALMIISGAFGVFEKDLVMAIGGYHADTVGEDMDLVTRLHVHMRESGQNDYFVRFIPDPVCWTEAPSSLRVLSRQRRRWQKGLLEVLSRNTDIFLNPKYGALGYFAYPFLFLFEGWGIILEAFGYLFFVVAWWRGALQTDFVLAFLFVAFFCGAVLSLVGVLLGEMTPRPYTKAVHWFGLTAFAFLENFGYRQLTSVLRLLGLADFVFNYGSWGHMERRGMAKT